MEINLKTNKNGNEDEDFDAISTPVAYPGGQKEEKRKAPRGNAPIEQYKAGLKTVPKQTIQRQLQQYHERLPHMYKAYNARECQPEGGVS